MNILPIEITTKDPEGIRAKFSFTAGDLLAEEMVSEISATIPHFLFGFVSKIIIESNVDKPCVYSPNDNSITLRISYDYAINHWEMYKQYLIAAFQHELNHAYAYTLCQFDLSAVVNYLTEEEAANNINTARIFTNYDLSNLNSNNSETYLGLTDIQHRKLVNELMTGHYAHIFPNPQLRHRLMYHMYLAGVMEQMAWAISQLYWNQEDHTILSFYNRANVILPTSGIGFDPSITTAQLKSGISECTALLNSIEEFEKTIDRLEDARRLCRGGNAEPIRNWERGALLPRKHSAG